MKKATTILFALLLIACAEPEVICYQAGDNGVCTFTSDSLYASTCVYVRLERVRTDHNANEKSDEFLQEFLAAPPLEKKVCSGIMLGGKQVERKFTFASPGNMQQATQYCSYSQWFMGREEDIAATINVDGATVGISRKGTGAPQEVKRAQLFGRHFVANGELTGTIADEFLASEEWVRQLSLKISRVIDGEAMTRCGMQVIFEGDR